MFKYYYCFPCITCLAKSTLGKPYDKLLRYCEYRSLDENFPAQKMLPPS